jgi:hypothetical protein
MKLLRSTVEIIAKPAIIDGFSRGNFFPFPGFLPSTSLIEGIDV